MRRVGIGIGSVRPVDLLLIPCAWGGQSSSSRKEWQRQQQQDGRRRQEVTSCCLLIDQRRPLLGAALSNVSVCLFVSGTGA